jgi:ABC-type spermidine/putrescine transport system permease subunit II
MLNSVILSGGTALVTVIAAALAAYPLSRDQTRFRRLFLYTIVFSTGLPITAIMVPCTCCSPTSRSPTRCVLSKFLGGGFSFAGGLKG